MPYAIDERNVGRQRLLAHLLDYFTETHLARLAPTRPGRWLNIGSGLGETTRMLTRFMAMDSTNRSTHSTVRASDGSEHQFAMDKVRI